MNMILIIAASVIFGCGFILILSLCKMSKCEQCNRFLDEDGKCIKCKETND